MNVKKGIVIDLEGYRRARAARRVEEWRRYDEELLCVNWNPAVGLVALSCYRSPAELSPELPESFANFDLGAFLDRVYALASQI